MHALPCRETFGPASTMLSIFKSSYTNREKLCAWVLAGRSIHQRLYFQIAVRSRSLVDQWNGIKNRVWIKGNGRCWEELRGIQIKLFVCLYLREAEFDKTPRPSSPILTPSIDCKSVFMTEYQNLRDSLTRVWPERMWWLPIALSLNLTWLTRRLPPNSQVNKISKERRSQNTINYLMFI